MGEPGNTDSVNRISRAFAILSDIIVEFEGLSADPGVKGDPITIFVKNCCRGPVDNNLYSIHTHSKARICDIKEEIG